MNLTPREKDKLLIAMAAEGGPAAARAGRQAQPPETVALITDFVVEGARDGRTVAELMEGGAHVVAASQVMDGVAAMIHDVQVEATFPDGTKLVTVHIPVREARRHAGPGEVLPLPGDLVLNEGRDTLTVTVANTGDRPIQVGSHYHFFETNPALQLRAGQDARLPARHPGRHRGAVRTRPDPGGRARGARGQARGLRVPPAGHGQTVASRRRSVARRFPPLDFGDVVERGRTRGFGRKLSHSPGTSSTEPSPILA